MRTGNQEERVHIPIHYEANVKMQRGIGQDITSVGARQCEDIVRLGEGMGTPRVEVGMSHQVMGIR